LEDKECEWSAAAFGMIGLETAFAVVVEAMIKTGLMDWARLTEVMSTKPAEIAGYANHGEFSANSVANLTLVDPEEVWTVDRVLTASRSLNTPFHGMEFTGKVIHTFFNGVQVVNHGELTGRRYEES
jgi:dihydroorotase